MDLLPHWDVHQKNVEGDDVGSGFSTFLLL